MTPGDTARVLAKAAAFDSRSIGDTDVAVWHEILGHLELQDALAAVTAHYREQTRRAMPADIRQLAIAHRDRRKEGQHLALPAGPTVRDRSPEVAALVQQVADNLPRPDLHERARARARQERGRPSKQLTQPPPKKSRKPPKDYPPPVDADGREIKEVAGQVRRYLRDGHDPADVADRFAVSRKWCRKQAALLGADPEAAAKALADDLHRQIATAKGAP